jgi:UDP-N-acetyl-D-glucosamine dehydrogenase
LRRGLSGSAILVLGLAYKKNVDDLRESPALRLMELIEARGGIVSYHDPLIPVLPRTRKHASLSGRRSVELTREAISGFDAVVIATDHDELDWAMIADAAKLVVDTRNACARAGITGPHIVKA